MTRGNSVKVDGALEDLSVSMAQSYKPTCASPTQQKKSNGDLKEKETNCNDGSKDSNANQFGWSRLRITVEPLFFCLIFVQTFSRGVLLNLLERNACIQKFNLSGTECTSLSQANATMKQYLEGEAAQVNLGIQLIHGLFPLALSLFVGPWSDKNGRKTFIILPFLGYFIYYFLWSLLSSFPYIPLRYMLVPAIPLSLSGGMVSVMVCCYCYLCDIFDNESRTFRFNIAMSCFLGGGLLANVTVSTVFSYGGEQGYEVVFLICSIVSGLALLYGWLCIKETRHKVQGKGRLFSLENARSVATVLFMRPTGELIILLLTIIVLVSEILLKAGENSVDYLVGKSEFSWALSHYTAFSAFNTVVAVLSSVLGSLIMRRLLKFENATIILISSLVLALSEASRALTSAEPAYWFSTGLSKVGALVGPTIAAEMSNVVSIEDLGKVYAFNALIDSGSAYLSVPIFTSLYRHLLLKDHTLYVYFLSSAISAVIVIAAVLLILKNKRYKEDVYHINAA